MANRQERKEGERDAERVNIDGVADGRKHLSDLSGIALSRLLEGSFRRSSC